MSTYCTVSSSDRFEFLYKYYHNYKNILSCERHCVIYMIESFMMKNHWEKYCKYYNSLNKNSLIRVIVIFMRRWDIKKTDTTEVINEKLTLVFYKKD